jgi:ribosome-associated protein
MIWIYQNLYLRDDELEFKAIRSQGSGGQNVNKVSTAIQLRFSIADSSLEDDVKAKLLMMPDSRLTEQGELIIKSQNHRNQRRNREEAVHRLREFFQKALFVRKKRKPTRPSRASVERRIQSKKRVSEKKASRKFRAD